jgi:hypothetical protein
VCWSCRKISGRAEKEDAREEKDTQNKKRKGKNRAADMPDMGGSANLKIAQKMMSKTKTKGKPAAGPLNKKQERKGWQ